MANKTKLASTKPVSTKWLKNAMRSIGVSTKSVLKENELLVHLIATHLMEIETLTKEDIYELVETGKLSWREKKKAKAEAERIAKEKEQELQDIYKKQLEAMQQNVNDIKDGEKPQ